MESMMSAKDMMMDKVSKKKKMMPDKDMSQYDDTHFWTKAKKKGR